MNKLLARSVQCPLATDVVRRHAEISQLLGCRKSWRKLSEDEVLDLLLELGASRGALQSKIREKERRRSMDRKRRRNRREISWGDDDSQARAQERERRQGPPRKARHSVAREPELTDEHQSRPPADAALRKPPSIEDPELVRYFAILDDISAVAK